MVLVDTVYTDNLDLFSSTFDLGRLLTEELKFEETLNEYVSALEDHTRKVKQFRDAVYGNKRNIADVEKHVSNPINCLRLTRRTGFDFYEHGVEELVKNDTLEELRNRLRNISSIFPTMNDHKEACVGFAVLQESYQLNSSELADGVVNHKGRKHFAEGPIDWIDMYHLGISTANQHWYDTSVAWFTLAIDRADRSNKAGYEVVLNEFGMMKQIHDHHLDKKGPVGMQHRTLGVPFNEKMRKKKKYRKARKNPPKLTRYAEYHPLFTASQKTQGGDLKFNFQSMCYQGSEEWRTHIMDKILKCRFVHHNNPFVKLGPFKVEEKSDDPFIVVFHEFMTPSEIEYYKSLGMKDLKRSTTGTGKNVKNNGKFKGRTSKQTWLQEQWFEFPIKEDEPFFEAKEVTDTPPVPPDVMTYYKPLDKIGNRISYRIQHATNFRIIGPFASESYQIANYGLGGQYTTHMDPHGYHEGALKDFEAKNLGHQTGDRIATFMVYLQGVELGGATVFPLTGTTIEATAGNAAFWVNMLKTGRPDKLTHHGGCPVLVGSKWITNKWIFYHDQMMKNPCDLDFNNQRFNYFNEWQYYKNQ